MGSNSISFASFLLFTFLILSSASNAQNRETLEIIIGGGSGSIIGGGYPSPPAPPPEAQNCPPPPPPVQICPPPPSPAGFENAILAQTFPVLQRLRNMVTSDPHQKLKNWNGPNICSYTGIGCAALPGTKTRAVYTFQFNEFNWYGPHLTLEGIIDKIPDISIVHANSNNFSGNIPAAISKLPYLFELDLSNNKYGGEFPIAVKQATNLSFLDLRFNSYSGRVPPEVFLLRVDVLFINNNNFVQNLPSNLGSTSALFLTFANNRFTGPIPKSIGHQAETLLEVLFLNNKLSGCLPYEIGKLKKARVFDVSRNDLTGPIPNSFACLAKMQILNLGTNKFYGEIPESICKLPKVSNITLSYNYFNRVGPLCKKLIDRKILDVKKNCLWGLPNQRSDAECRNFYSKCQKCPDAKSMLRVPCCCPCAPGYEYLDDQKNDKLDSTKDTASAPMTYGALVHP